MSPEDILALAGDHTGLAARAILGRKAAARIAELEAEIARLTAALAEAEAALRLPADGYREGAEAMREASAQAAETLETRDEEFMQRRPEEARWADERDTGRQMAAADIRALPLSSPPAEEKDGLARIAELEAALKPFADCVFNDNGDVTIDLSQLIGTAPYYAAYRAYRAALSDPSGD